MIISRTPFRISFFGGGTDYPAWYRDNGGAVLSTSIDKYCYISCRRLPPFFEYRHRIVYSKTEHCNSIDDILHPAVREVFRFIGVNEGLEIHHDGDLPARAGLGSSSTFTVGLLHALYALQGRIVSKEQLAREAIHVEQDLIREDVGSQDQIAAAFGGLNRISFMRENEFSVDRLTLNREKKDLLQRHLLLLFTGFARSAPEIAHEVITMIRNRHGELNALRGMVDAAIGILNRSGDDITDFGRLLHESWSIKRSLTARITTPHIDEIYESAQQAGAIGGKLLGAGGGGFMLLFARPEHHQRIRERLKQLLFVPFQFENMGSQIVVYQPDGLY